MSEVIPPAEPPRARWHWICSDRRLAGGHVGWRWDNTTRCTYAMQVLFPQGEGEGELRAG